MLSVQATYSKIRRVFFTACSNIYLPVSFSRLSLDQKFAVVGGAAGILSSVIYSGLWITDNTEVFKQHKIQASVIRPQQSVGLNIDATLGTYIIFENKGDYPEIVTRIRAELYLPFRLESVILGSEVPDILALQVQENISSDGDRRVSDFLKEGGYIKKSSSRLPSYVEPPEYKNILAFGKKFKQYRYILQGCNESLVITNNKPYNIVTKASFFKFPNQLNKTIKNNFLLVETGLFEDTIVGVLSDGDVKIEYYVGELLIVVEFINPDGRVDSRVVDATNVYLVASKSKKYLKFSDWWNGFPGHFELTTELSKSDLINGRNKKVEFKRAKGADLKDYVISIADIPMGMPTPSFFDSQDHSLCEFEQTIISK
ncbi:hypothetical protein [Thalassomonas actiniarum]|uniref:Uncharacterized protein n=1 Tax=Thalassomonas actiniarum TaxID=485447 RepID=A0AAF0C221_9GAMM|nr:hypothetical protein [Thalassomonas actiniarum]WDD99606.1 hypothetical protein SG35_002720 [Thalassomonas actiniarum]